MKVVSPVTGSTNVSPCEEAPDRRKGATFNVTP